MWMKVRTEDGSFWFQEREQVLFVLDILWLLKMLHSQVDCEGCEWEIFAPYAWERFGMSFKGATIGVISVVNEFFGRPDPTTF